MPFVICRSELQRQACLDLIIQCGVLFYVESTQSRSFCYSNKLDCAIFNIERYVYSVILRALCTVSFISEFVFFFLFIFARLYTKIQIYKS